MVRIVGRVLWFRERDGFGVITDLQNNDYYFHRNEIKASSKQSIKKGTFVNFSINQEVDDVLCATNISALTQKQKVTIRNKIKQLNVQL